MSQVYTYPTVLFQGITYTAKRWGQFPTITYVDSLASAGFEVATVDSNLNIFVSIKAGVTTTAQVIAAIAATIPSLNNLLAGDLVSTQNTTPGTVTAATSSAMTGANAGNPGLGFYADQSTVTLTTTYQYLRFENVMGEITFNNDETSGTKQLSFSWDGVNVHGIIGATQAMSFDRCNKSGVYVKYVTGSPAFRITTTAQ
jgi:hypothetical protein